MAEPRHTQSLCPVCLSLLPAKLVQEGQEVRLKKYCSEHGHFSVPIWRGPPAFGQWARSKLPSQPPVCHTRARSGCPFDCGLCPEHAQHTCTALLEVTRGCNLSCPICFAQSGTSGPDPDLGHLEQQLGRIRSTAGACTLQISGGEPTVREDLPEIVELAAKKGFALVQLNTNGLRLAREPGYAELLRDCGLQSVFLQFDSVRDGAYAVLRGRPLRQSKMRALEALARAGLGTVLVPTLVPGVNTQDIGSIISLALQYHPCVRGVHFQPVSYFGRYSRTPTDAERITLPEVMRALKEQTQGRVRVQDFAPPGCEHALCSFHATYLVDGSKVLNPLSGSCPCSFEPVQASIGARQSVALTAERWQAPDAREIQCGPEADDLDTFLLQARQQSFTVSGMAFQDVWTLDIQRLRGCCIHVSTADGRLIPFCAYNLTSAHGKALYRGALDTGQSTAVM